MKFPYLKSLLAASALLMVFGCGDENPTGGNTTSSNNAIVVDETSFLYESNGVQYVISTSGQVYDVDGNSLGLADFTTGDIAIIDSATQQPILIGQGVDFMSLETIQPTVISGTAWVFKDNDQTYVVYPAEVGIVDANGNQLGVVTDATGAQIGIFVFTPGTLTGSIISSDGITPLVPNVDLSVQKTYASNVKQEEPSSSSVAQDDPTTPNDPYIPGEFTPLDPGTTPQSSSSVAKSSSSVAKSSSSKARSSSSQGGSTGGSYTIKYVSGGKSGSGWATRYWDCCKPHCAWPDKGGLKAHACDAQGNKINDDGATSMCDGGNAGICRGQFPIVVNDNMAFAFAAVPGSAGGQCGKCYDLEFTGQGKYATDNHKALKGKHLIVIASNIGYDVQEGQFDIMIPGGGFGIFDGCSAKMGWGSQGARYGGLLTECEESSGYKASTYKSCLTQKCNQSFSSDPQAKEGCLFLANWMNAAGNPLHNYKEVECPKELLDRF